jgi:membrane-associated protein
MNLVDAILHLDIYLDAMVNTYHTQIYFILFLVIFCETGLVVTPFLPGDSLLFIAGGLASTGQLNIILLAIIIIIGAFLGDNCNFILGRFIGHKLFNNKGSKIFRHDILEKTHVFYEKHGASMVIFARFVPLIRTFAPFVAGVGEMKYSKFIVFSLIASGLWVMIFLFGGFLFANIHFIKHNMSIFILFIMILSLLPIVKIFYKDFYKKGQ